MGLIKYIKPDTVEEFIDCVLRVRAPFSRVAQSFVAPLLAGRGWKYYFIISKENVCTVYI